MTTTTGRSTQALRSLRDSVTTTSLTRRISRTPIWPDYFARLGQPDAANWQYQGYWRDTARVWRAYYSLMLGHPKVGFLGMRHFYQSLAYRISNEETGDHIAPFMTLVTPVGMAITPFASLLAVATVPPYLRKVKNTEIPPLFRPFNLRGWSNYNIMLVTMFTLHSYKQQQLGWSPDHALKHSSKVFWHDFFQTHLPEGHHETRQYGVMKDGVLKGEIPEDSFVIKPTKGGAGQYLRTWEWDADARLYHCRDKERGEDEPETCTPDELRTWILGMYRNAVIERLERMRAPFPVSSFRVMTLNVDGKSELIAAVFLPADEGSNSTAYFDLDTHLVDYEHSRVGMPIRPQSDGRWTGIEVPELEDVIETCIGLHDELPAHVEVSWDVLLTDDGPVYLEGNIFPPGCDYKLTVFKTWKNFTYLRDRLLAFRP
ncbi:MAG: sugar-transfer associated ATP-grasp domain-containing protein [Candidatus Nanopelagicales bacterium]